MLLLHDDVFNKCIDWLAQRGCVTWKFKSYLLLVLTFMYEVQDSWFLRIMRIFFFVSCLALSAAFLNYVWLWYILVVLREYIKYFSVLVSLCGRHVELVKYTFPAAFNLNEPKERGVLWKLNKTAVWEIFYLNVPKQTEILWKLDKIQFWQTFNLNESE